MYELDFRTRHANAIKHTTTTDTFTDAYPTATELIA